ncbi:MAG: hypothetical protein WC802_02735 [Patescibacteria group bacterium]|jgi:hypothetical protein
MVSLAVKLQQKEAKTLHLEIDRPRFERLAGIFGFFGQGFLRSIDRAEDDIRAGRITKLSSLKDLRKS